MKQFLVVLAMTAILIPTLASADSADHLDIPGIGARLGSSDQGTVGGVDVGFRHDFDTFTGSAMRNSHFGRVQGNASTYLYSNLDNARENGSVDHRHLFAKDNVQVGGIGLSAGAQASNSKDGSRNSHMFVGPDVRMTLAGVRASGQDLSIGISEVNLIAGLVAGRTSVRNPDHSTGENSFVAPRLAIEADKISGFVAWPLRLQGSASVIPTNLTGGSFKHAVDLTASADITWLGVAGVGAQVESNRYDSGKSGAFGEAEGQKSSTYYGARVHLLW